MTAAPGLQPEALDQQPHRPRPGPLCHCVTAAAARSPEERDAQLAEVTATIRQVIRL